MKADRPFEAKDFVGGHEAIDLVNTVTARDAAPVDRLHSYAELLQWTSVAGVFSENDLDTLERLADTDVGGAAKALQALKETREALYKVLTALVAERKPDEDAVQSIERAWKMAIENCVWAVRGGHVSLSLPITRAGLDYIRQVVALRAYELLCTLRIERTRVCSGDRCGWLFIDSSRGGKRRWCDMSVCGSAAKSKRYQLKRNRS